MGDTQPLYPCEETCFAVTAAETTTTTSCIIDMANSMTKAFGAGKGDKEEEEEEDDLYHKSSPVSVLENSATSSELTTSHDCGYSIVPGRARSKRSRTGARIWTSRILSTSSSVTSFESMMGPESSYASMSFSPSPGASGDSNSGLEDQDGEENSQSSKRCKTTHNNHQSSNQQNSHHQNVSNSSSKSKKKNQDITQPWRCMHCQTQRTPQWRTGPMGPKTLCNACGVRFKSGRLLPEYRPAGSPTYVAAKHSHSHKKVLEMRRDREMMRQHPSPSPSPSPPSSHNMQTHQTHMTPQQQQQQHHHQHQCGGVSNAVVEFPSLDLQNCFSKPTDLLPNFAGVEFAQNCFGVEEEHSINRDRGLVNP